jgi:hypothetical protein
MKSKRFLTALIAMTIAVQTMAANVAESTDHPGALSLSEVPLFILIGWDDNTNGPAIDWATSLYDGKLNPDGTPATASFFMNSSSFKDDDVLIKAIDDKLVGTHEVGNHTYDHHDAIDDKWGEMTKFLRIDATASEWEEILQKGLDTLVDYTDATVAKVTGFRAPFLEYGTNLYPALEAIGARYDHSIENRPNDDLEWSWPYTMDNGSESHNSSWKNDGDPQQFTVPDAPGLWQIPVHGLALPDDETCEEYGIATGLRDGIKAKLGDWAEFDITGFDYNLWTDAKLDSADFVGVLKYNLDLRFSGNRAPFLFGAHTQYYIKNWANTNAANASAAQMKGAISEFMAYARSKGAYFVSCEQLLDWCENPVALDTDKGNFSTDEFGGGVEREPEPEPDPDPVEVEDVELVDLNVWSIDKDNYGSEGTFEFKESVSASCTLTLVEDDAENKEWAYTSLRAAIDETLDGVEKIEITYTSDEPIKVALTTGTYGFSKELEAGTDVTVELVKSDFSHVWGTETLDYSEVTGISIEATKVGETQVSVTSLKLYQSGGSSPISAPIAVSKSSSFKLLGINSSSMKLSVPVSGRYNIKLYSLDGRMLAQQTKILTSGISSIQLNRSLAQGMILVRIQGVTTEFVSKFLVR